MTPRESGDGGAAAQVATHVLTEAELREAVGLEREGVEAIAEGFALLAAGRVTQPPILRVDVPRHRGELDVKSAYVDGWDSFAVKLSTGFFGNPSRGLPTGLGMMVLLSAETGAVQAVLLDNGYLTRIRTALAGAVAARHLARERVRVVGIVGAGDQARWQLRALRLVRGFERARVWARRPREAARYAADMTAELGVEVTPVDDPARVFAASDVVVTTTPSTEPLVRREWLEPGMHVTAIGSDAESKQELSAETVVAADLFVCDHVGQSRRLGELRSVERMGLRLRESAVELGTIVSGAHAGRTREEQTTVCDLTGTGVQDTVIARLALERCRAAGAGRVVAQHPV